MKKLQVGLTENEELAISGNILYHGSKAVTVDWLLDLRPWIQKADLTFECMAAPERAEKCVRRWLCDAAPGCWAIVGYERQERGAVHAHALIDKHVTENADHLWNRHAGFCRIGIIHSNRAALLYVLKHGVKAGDWDIYGPGEPDHWLRRGPVYSTGNQGRLPEG